MTAALVLAASVFAAVALFAPRSVTPSRLPALYLDEDAAARAIEEDYARAATAPHDRWSNALRALHAEIGRGAHESVHSLAHVRSRYRLAERRARSVRQDHGDEGLWAIRAEAVTRMDAALAHEMPRRPRRELLGKLESQLERYHVRSEEGQLRAPKLVAWTMFKARWNRISGLEPTAGFSPVEARAYHGWLALHGRGAPERARFEAALSFERAGGHRGAEAVAVWAMRLGISDVAHDALARAIQSRRSVRLRNYRIALTQRAP